VSAAEPPKAIRPPQPKEQPKAQPQPKEQPKAQPQPKEQPKAQPQPPLIRPVPVVTGKPVVQIADPRMYLNQNTFNVNPYIRNQYLNQAYNPYANPYINPLANQFNPLANQFNPLINPFNMNVNPLANQFNPLANPFNPVANPFNMNVNPLPNQFNPLANPFQANPFANQIVRGPGLPPTPALIKPIVTPAKFHPALVFPATINPWGGLTPPSMIGPSWTPATVITQDNSNYIPISAWTAIDPNTNSFYDARSETFIRNGGIFTLNPITGTYTNPLTGAQYNPITQITITPISGGFAR